MISAGIHFAALLLFRHTQSFLFLDKSKGRILLFMVLAFYGDSEFVLFTISNTAVFAITNTSKVYSKQKRWKHLWSNTLFIF